MKIYKNASISQNKTDPLTVYHLLSTRGFIYKLSLFIKRYHKLCRCRQYKTIDNNCINFRQSETFYGASIKICSMYFDLIKDSALIYQLQKSLGGYAVLLIFIDRFSSMVSLFVIILKFPCFNSTKMLIRSYFEITGKI